MPETVAVLRYVGKDQASAEAKRVRDATRQVAEEAKYAKGTFGALEVEAKKLNAELRNLTHGTDAFAAKAKQLKGVNTELGKVRLAALGAQGGVRGLVDGFAGRFGLSSAAAGTAAVGAGLAFVTAESLKAASAVEELESKSEIVYGSAFPEMEQQAEKIAVSVGRARSAVLGMSTDFASIIGPMGVSIEEAKKMSSQFAQLSIDMASFHNKTDEEAFVALRSAITGEAEPMKRFGVVMTDANLAAFALSKGIRKNITDMTQAEKTTLRYNFIMERTSQTHGDAARTADSASNQFKRMGGNVKGLFEQLGKPALPIAKAGMLAFNMALEGGITLVKSFNDAMAGSFGTLMKFGTLAAQAIGFSRAGLGAHEASLRKPGLQIGVTTPNITELSGAELNAMRDAATEARKAKEEAERGMGGGEGETILDKVKKIVNDIAGAEDDINAALREQTDLNKARIKERRDDLKLHKELGVLTEQENRELERINGRMEFKNEMIDEATDAWRDQVKAIGEVEGKISDLNKRIVEERTNLQETLDGIGKSSSEDAVQKAADLIRERNKIREQATGAFGITGDMGRRLGEIEGDLGTFNASTLSEAEKVAGMGAGEVIEREKQMKIDAAKAESQARVEAIQSEIDKETEALEALRATENERKQLIIDALADRQTQTELTYKNLEDATKAHVDAQIEQFNRLKATLEALTGANASISGFESGISTTLGGPALVPNALGGIYDSPTAALIGEAGYPEAVIPMPFGNVPVKLQGGGSKVEINAPLVGQVIVKDEADEDRLIQKLTRILQLQQLHAA